MQFIKDHQTVLFTLVVMALVDIAQHLDLISADQAMGLMALLGTAGSAKALYAPVPVTSKTGPGAGAVALLLLLVAPQLVSCTPAERSAIPVLSTIDAVGIGVAKVAHWCDEAGADDATFERAKKAAREKDYAQAVALLSEVATNLRTNGHDVPDDAFVTLKLVEGALAASAIEQGMRALSSPREPETEPSEAGAPSGS